MNQCPSYYDRTNRLVSESFGVDLQSVGIQTENQLKVEYPQFSPAEVVMEIREDFDLEFK